jgi:hypothetical protein
MTILEPFFARQEPAPASFACMRTPAPRGNGAD